VIYKILAERPGFLIYPLFAWQQSCSAFSVSKSQLGIVCNYILNQPEHHKIHTFEEEYQAYINEFQQPFNPKVTA